MARGEIDKSDGAVCVTDAYRYLSLLEVFVDGAEVKRAKGTHFRLPVRGLCVPISTVKVCVAILPHQIPLSLRNRAEAEGAITIDPHARRGRSDRSVERCV